MNGTFKGISLGELVVDIEIKSTAKLIDGQLVADIVPLKMTLSLRQPSGIDRLLGDLVPKVAEETVS